MSKIKKMILGIALAMCVFGGSVGSCYAAVNVKAQITLDLTANRAYGKFVYEEQGHEIEVLVDYTEVHISTGLVFDGHISDVQHGIVTEAVASRPSPSGFRYRWGRAYGYVDQVFLADSSPVYLG